MRGNNIKQPNIKSLLLILKLESTLFLDTYYFMLILDFDNVYLTALTKKLLLDLMLSIDSEILEGGIDVKIILP